MAIRPEVLQKILEDASGAKPVEGSKDAYDPEEYNKVRARQEAMALLNEAGNDGYLEPQIGEGAIEFDARGNLKHIARTQPKLIDTRRLTANRYAKQTVKPGTLCLRAGTDILFVFGGAAIRAFENTTLTPQVKVYRFHFNTKSHEWQYVRAELIEDKVAYSTMTNSLNGASALALIHKIEQDVVKTAEVEGDSLDSILNSAEKNSGENLQDEAPEVPKAPNVGAVKEKGDSLNDIK